MPFEPHPDRIALYGRATAHVDLTSPDSIRFWTRLWNVTLIQLRIAVGRAGPSPPDVAKELGLGPNTVRAISQESHAPAQHPRRSG